MYDTDTATMIDCYNDNQISDDEYQYCEELYQKHTKEYFLFGMGGVYTIYGRYPNQWTITPLTDKEAQNWLEEYGDVDIYIDLFGTPEE